MTHVDQIILLIEVGVAALAAAVAVWRGRPKHPTSGSDQLD